MSISMVSMLWFDDDPTHTLTEKIGRAAMRYRQKYGVYPNLVYANPRTTGVDSDTEQRIRLGDHTLTLKQARSIQPDHFWLGIASD